MSGAPLIPGGLRPHHVAFSVSDLDEAAHWWGEAFGFRVAHRFELGGGATLGAYLEAGEVWIELFQRQGSAPTPRPDPTPGQDRVDADLLAQGLRHPAFRVADLDAAVAELKHRGVTFARDPRTFPIDDQLTIRVAFFQDPYGNLCELVQELDPPRHGATP